MCAAFLLAAGMIAFPVRTMADNTPSHPGREYLLPREEVYDTFLGYLIGLICTDTSADVDYNSLLTTLPELVGVPGFKAIRRFALTGPDSQGELSLSFWFGDALYFPVPISIFGYHPGSIDGSGTIRLKETRHLSVWADPYGPLYVFQVEQGWAKVDFDQWLDTLAGSLLDDFTVWGAALLGYRGNWCALLIGLSPSKRIVTYAFDLKHNKILFPAPRDLTKLAAELIKADDGSRSTQ